MSREASTTRGNGRGDNGGGPARADRRSIDFGPSMRTRARAMVAVAFAICLPALLVGVVRATEANEQTEGFLAGDQLSDAARRLQLEIEQARTALWHLEAEPAAESRLGAKRALDSLSRSILSLEQQIETDLRRDALATEMTLWKDDSDTEPLIGLADPLRRLKEATGRVRRAVDPVLADKGRKAPDAAALRRARTALQTAWRDANTLVQGARRLTAKAAASAEASLSRAGRDQLVLFLLLFFAFPLVIGFGPTWMVAPLERLKGLSARIAQGKAREIRARGTDEVAEVTRALGQSLSRLEEDERSRRGKIFEIRKVLLRVLQQVKEPVLVVGRAGTVDYANAAAAEMFRDEIHHLEGKPLEEICFSPGLVEALDRARGGDVEEDGVDITVETADGRVQACRAVLGTVQDQKGRTSRVVVVLHP